MVSVRFRPHFSPPGFKAELDFRERDIRWNESKKHRNSDKSIQQLTGPKPDFTYGFPINKTVDRLAPGFQDHELVTNFLLEVLGKLRSDGLISSPLTGLEHWPKAKKLNWSQSHLVCFPWAVVELNPVYAQDVFCYDQAANAASAALTIFDDLCKKATGVDSPGKSPVVAFTCIGPSIRLWLAYSSPPQSTTVCHVS